MTKEVKCRISSFLSVLLVAVIFVLPVASVTAEAAGISINASMSMTSVYVGGTVTVKGSGSSGTAPYYYKFQYKVGSGSWQVVKAYSTVSTATFTIKSAGNYTVRTYVKDKTGKEIYRDMSFTAKEKYVALANNSTISATSVNLGNTVTVNGKASGGAGSYQYLYQYQIYDGSWQTVKSYSTTASLAIKLPSAGYYTVKCTVKDKDNKTAEKTFSVTVNNKTSAALVNASTIASTSVKLGSTVRVNGKGTGGSQPYQYAFYYQNGSTWVTVNNYQKRSYSDIKLPSAGTFTVKSVVKDTTGKAVSKTFNVTVTNATGKTLSNTSSINTTTLADQNTTVTMSGKASGGTQPYKFAYYYKLNNGSWITLKNYSTATSAPLKLSSVGTYTLKVNVQDYANKVVSKTFTVTTLSTAASATKVSSTKTINYGNIATVTATAGVSGTKYEFYYKKSGETQWAKLAAYSTSRTVSFRPEELTDYTVLVNKNVNGKVTSERYIVRPEISSAMKTELSLINNERSKRGIAPVQLDYSLTYCAGIRSEEIAVKYSHTRPNGKVCSTVVLENSVDFGGLVAENIASGYSAPKSTMTAWMSSSDHSKNILNKNLTKVGLGINGQYWVQIFTN